ADLLTGIPITLNDRGGFIDVAGYKFSLVGIISGPGALNLESTVASTGTLVLTGNNTYTGGTVINSGILSINGDTALGIATSSVTFNGGTLQMGGPHVTTARDMTLNAGGTIDTNDFDFLYSGSIKGTGALTKTGGGILTLTGNNVYTGGTTVSNGTLQL